MPRLSVIIPAYNAESDLAAALNGLANSTYHDFECIIADDGSTDASIEVARQSPLQPKIVRCGSRGGPSRARNHGVAASSGEILVFLDADVVCHPDVLARIAAAFEDPTLHAIMGSYDDAPHHPEFLSQYRNLLHCFFHQTGRPRASTFWSGCGAVRREAFLAVGGFDESWFWIEDIELGYRLIAAGYRIALDPSIHVKHRKRWTFRGMIRTDVIGRGVPWTLLILRQGGAPDDLNTGTAQRLSVALVAALALLLVTQQWIWAAATATVIAILNRRLFLFFMQKRGWWFSLRAFPLFLLYLFYSGLSFVLGAAQHAGLRLFSGYGAART